MKKLIIGLGILALACGKDKATDPGGSDPPPPPPPPAYHTLRVTNVNVDSIRCFIDGDFILAGGEGESRTVELEDGEHHLWVKFINDWYPDYIREGPIQIHYDVHLRFLWPDSIDWN